MKKFLHKPPRTNRRRELKFNLNLWRREIGGVFWGPGWPRMATEETDQCQMSGVVRIGRVDN